MSEPSGSHRPTVGETLLPLAGAARRARNVTTEACLRWGLGPLTGPACIAATELVTNAVVHAGTMIDFRVARGRRYLLVLVEDGNRKPAVLARQPTPGLSSALRSGMGLSMVDFAADRWGCWILPRGKVVWAAFRAPMP